MKIIDIVRAPGRTGFFFDDQRAVKMGATADGEAYDGKPVTPGFTAVRQAGESISVLLVLEDGQIAHGDCAAVQYSGAGGRDPLFLAENFIPMIDKHIKPAFVGLEADSFRGLTQRLDDMTVDGNRLHTAIRYGVSQALLDAVAKSSGCLMCDVIAREYGGNVVDTVIPIFSQSGDNRYNNADKMILKCAQVLPHALINTDEKIGKNGEVLLQYVQWLRDRILKLRTDENYSPVMHLDVYGTIGSVFGNSDFEAMADYIETLSKAAKPFDLLIEGPMDVEEREGQMKAMRELTAVIDRRGGFAGLVADEWCNTLEDIKYFADNRAGHMIQIKTPDLGNVGDTAEAVLYCKSKGVGAYLGGTCNETDRSAQICAHVAMATGPDQILAKPGMGVDEGYMIVYNEMHRILALKKRGAAC